MPDTGSFWIRARQVCAAVGIAAGAAAGIGWARDPGEFGFSYLLAFMFFLSLGLGALFLVMLHHLVDAGWSVPIRRVLEHLAMLAPALALLFVPIAIVAPQVYPWLAMADHPDAALESKRWFLNPAFFYARALAYFAIWSVLAWRLRAWSLRQDRSGAAECTRRMRRWSAAGMFLFAITVTLAAIDWMQSLQHHWSSTIYGVLFFAGSVWATLAWIFLAAAILRLIGPLREVVHARQFHDIGVLLLAFTLFYAYIHFSQYFLIWTAHIPEETFWYAQRGAGGWRGIGLWIVFGHFLAPFLLLLRIDAKQSMALMLPLCGWALLMHYLELAYHIMPVLRPDGFRITGLDMACLLAIDGALGAIFALFMSRHPAYPIRDPRLQEALAGAGTPPVSAPETAAEDA